MYESDCADAAWYGYKSDEDVGSISATFSGSGSGTLSFGNCHSGGKVEVYLTSDTEVERLGTAMAHEKMDIAFHYESGDTLYFKEYEVAIIALYWLRLSCNHERGMGCCKIN